jgi:hypothetical protein
MTQDEMKMRTKRFALRVIKLVESLPNIRAASVIGKQLVRCGTSLIDGASQIVSIIVSSIKTLKRKRNPKSAIPIPKSI